MAQTAEALVVIGRGRLIAASTVDEFLGRFADSYVTVRSPNGPQLAALLARRGATLSLGKDGALEVRGVNAVTIGQMAAANGFVLHELAPRTASLEEAFLEVTRGEQEFSGGAPSA